MRAISRVLNVPLSTVFKWGVTVGGSMRSWLSCGGRLRRFWRARLLLRLLTRCGLLYKNSRAFYKWVFTCYVYTTLGLFVLFSVGGREGFQGDLEVFTARWEVG